MVVLRAREPHPWWYNPDRSGLLPVGVGIVIAHNPLHRSGRADFPHPALASGDDAKSPQGVGVAHAGEGQPAVDESPHPVPENPAVLATPRHGTPPEPPYLVPKRTQRRTVHGHPEVAD